MNLDESYKFITGVEELADKNKDTLFLYKGIIQEGFLMATMLKKTRKIARIFSCGDREMLVTEEHYWYAMLSYLEDKNKQIRILVDYDNKLEDKAHFVILKKIKEVRGDDSIQIKLISEEDKQNIFDRVAEYKCNFGAFDGDKFKFEGDEGAYASFNRPDISLFLAEVFDDAFNSSNSKILL